MRTSRRAVTASLAFALVSLVASACAESPVGPTTGTPTGTSGSGSGSGSGNTQASVAGTYRLTSVDGSALPTVFDSFSPGPGVVMEMKAISGQIVLRTDGSYHQEYETSLSGRGTSAGISSVRAVDGQYRFENNSLTLTPQGGTAFHPDYGYGQIDITTSAPGLNGEIDLVTFTFRR